VARLNADGDNLGAAGCDGGSDSDLSAFESGKSVYRVC